MSDKKQTAVEWYENQIMQLEIKKQANAITLGEYAVQRFDLFKQAKEMEREQIMNAYKQAHSDGYHFDGSRSDYESEGLDKYLAENYFEETYGE